jgi:uncharacterized protein with HEPN domain
MDERVRKWLEDILVSIGDIEEYIGPRPRRFVDFKDNRLVRDGVERRILVIGEAMSRILKVYPDIPIEQARRIVNTRNYVVHGYDSLEVEMIWNIVINHLPPLKAEVEKLLEV